LDQDAAKETYAQIQAILMDELPTFQAWYRPFLHTVKKTFSGYVDSAAYGLFHELENWTVTE
jgi:ABC-type transport system substrate-binding protein